MEKKLRNFSTGLFRRVPHSTILPISPKDPLHYYLQNLTGIIDIDGNCCFVMPLNRKRVLPPRSLSDLVNKMSDGYYEVNTKVVRETMRAVLPPLSNLTSVGAYIRKECKHMPTYLLEKVTHTGELCDSMNGRALQRFLVL